MKIYPNVDVPVRDLTTEPYPGVALPFTAIAKRDETGGEVMFINFALMSRTGVFPRCDREHFPVVALISIDPVGHGQTEPQILTFEGTETRLQVAGGATADLAATYHAHPREVTTVRQIRVTRRPDGGDFTLDGSSWALWARYAAVPDGEGLIDGTPAPSFDWFSFVVDGADATPSLLVTDPIRVGRDTDDDGTEHLIEKILVGQRYETSPLYIVHNRGFATLSLGGDGERASGPVTIRPRETSLTPGSSTPVTLSVAATEPGRFKAVFPLGASIGDPAGRAALEVRGIADLPPIFVSEGPQFSQFKAQPGDVVRAIGDRMDAIIGVVLLGSPGLEYLIRTDGATRTAVQFKLPTDAPRGTWLVALAVRARYLLDPSPETIRQLDGTDYLILATSTQFLTIS